MVSNGLSVGGLKHIKAFILDTMISVHVHVHLYTLIGLR